jgi:hypothetical protein
MWIDDARDVNLPIPATPSGEAWWKKVKAGTMVLFWLRDNEDCRLSMMEVTNTNVAEHDFTGWYYIHRAAARVYRFGRPQCEMKYAPEWKDSQGMSYAAPAESLKPKLTRLLDHFDSNEVEIIYSGFSLESDGKVPRRVCDAADVWLRKAARTEPSCIKSLSYPTDLERARGKKM